MYFITSNYNNIYSNSNWDKIKREAIIDSNFNNFFLSLNDQKIKLLKNSIFKDIKKTFFLYFFLKNHTNLIESKKFNDDFQVEIQKLKINKNKNIFSNKFTSSHQNKNLEDYITVGRGYP
jgi:hypothetical protein